MKIARSSQGLDLGSSFFEGGAGTSLFRIFLLLKNWAM
jgi:hypothetical protein